jgi:hypothetical protein
MCDNNNSNGFDPKIWGPYVWKCFHFSTFAYPVNPSNEHIEKSLNFYQNFDLNLPCESCKESYLIFIKTEPTLLNREILKNRNNLTKWGFDLHNRVNKKLGINYNLAYDDFINHYESARIKCLPNNDQCIIDQINKIKSYKISEYQECVIINKDLADKFKDYAKKRNVILKTDYYYDISKNCHSKKWINRNNQCQYIKHYMKCNMIPSIELEGKYKGWPSIYELELISRLSTSVNIDYLNHIIKSKIKKYKLR